MMFRATSEMAVAMSVASVAENPSDSATRRPELAGADDVHVGRDVDGHGLVDHSATFVQ